MADDSEQAWSEWWDLQYGLCREFDHRIDQAAAGRSDQYRVALVASLIEHLAERQRTYLHLPASDSRKDSETGTAMLGEEASGG
jgi:hypothetical protein